MFSKRIFDSPTLMTLFSLTSKSLSFILITPFLLSSFLPEEIAMWYLLGLFINMQALADFGFYNTFVRVIALALSGGCSTLEDLNKIENRNRMIGMPNTELAGNIIGTMKRVYLILTLLLALIMLLLSPTLSKNVYQLSDPTEGWAAWAIVIIFSTINFYGRPYSNYLLSLNKVALVRKWEGCFNIIALLVNIVVVLKVKSLLLLVITNQIWILVNVLVNRYLCEHTETFKFSSFNCYKYDKNVMESIWPLAWRAGLSSVTTQGIVSASGLIYAQFCDAASASTYLFAEKIYNALRSFAQAPFYSKVPYLVNLRGRNELEQWTKVAQKGMFMASLLMAIGIIVLDAIGVFVFKLINSNIEFPNHTLWLLLGWAYLLHRYGAMHTQLYTTINKVNSHISDLASGIIMVLVWWLFADKLDVYVFPIGMLCGYLGFYDWFAGYYSYKVMILSPFRFEIKANAIPFFLLLFYTIVHVCLNIN